MTKENKILTFFISSKKSLSKIKWILRTGDSAKLLLLNWMSWGVCRPFFSSNGDIWNTPSTVKPTKGELIIHKVTGLRYKSFQIRDVNFRIIDIEINAWSPLFVSKMLPVLIAGPEQLIRRQKNYETLARNQWENLLDGIQQVYTNERIKHKTKRFDSRYRDLAINSETEFSEFEPAVGDSVTQFKSI